MVGPNESTASEAPTDDLISPIVEEFTFRSLEDDALDLETFCEGYPTEIREELRNRCRITRNVQRSLRSVVKRAHMPRSHIGEFEIREELGRGATGIVYLAYQPSLDRLVALKVLALDPLLSPRAVLRFHREATAASKLSFPSIVQVHSVGEDDGLLYIAMEYIDGRTLAEHMREPREAARADESGSEWTLGRSGDRSHLAHVAQIIARLAEALEHAHSHGIIHRDVKPDNVIIDREGHPYLVDFGLAKVLAEESISTAGDLAGTPHYMSPEQTLAKRIPVDHRTDVFSLGIVMYELLTRRKPFIGDTLQRILYEISFKDPTPIRHIDAKVPRDLATICHKAMEKRPDHRFDSAEAMAQDLRRFLNHESIEARAPGIVERARRGLVRHRVAAALLAIVAVAAVWVPLLALRLSRAVEIDRLEEPIREIAATTDLRTAALHTLFEAANNGLELNRREAGDRELIDRQEARILGHAKRQFDEAWQVILGSRLDPTTLAAVWELSVVAVLLPRGGDVAALFEDDAFLCRVTMDSEPSGAEVVLQELDYVDGSVLSVRQLGTTPLEGVGVAPSYYRIVVELEGRGYAELTRLLDRPSAEYDLGVVRVLDTASVVRDMTQISSSPFRFGSESEYPGDPYGAKIVELEPYWIDRYEVSNREYAEFVAATGQPWPRYWPDFVDARWDDLPVVGVSYSDARAFAEWAGKRLPSVEEWERASRGIDGALYPRDLADVPLQRYALRGSDDVPLNVDPADEVRYIPAARADYLKLVRPTRSDPELATLEGFAHMLDNVREWTDTILFLREPNEEYRWQLGWRITKGGSFKTRSGSVTLANIYPAPAAVRDHSIGFRCAKSVRSQ